MNEQFANLLKILSGRRVEYVPALAESEAFVTGTRGTWPDELAFGDDPGSKLIALHEALHLYVSGPTFCQEEVVMALERELVLRFFPELFPQGNLFLVPNIRREFQSSQRQDFWTRAVEIIQENSAHTVYCLNLILEALHGDDNDELPPAKLTPFTDEEWAAYLELQDIKPTH